MLERQEGYTTSPSTMSRGHLNHCIHEPMIVTGVGTKGITCSLGSARRRSKMCNIGAYNDLHNWSRLRKARTHAKMQICTPTLAQAKKPPITPFFPKRIGGTMGLLRLCKVGPILAANFGCTASDVARNTRKWKASSGRISGARLPASRGMQRHPKCFRSNVHGSVVDMPNSSHAEFPVTMRNHNGILDGTCQGLARKSYGKICRALQ